MDEDEADAIFRALDYVVQRYITRREFVLATSRVWEDMHGLAHTLQDFSAVTRALKYVPLYLRFPPPLLQWLWCHPFLIRCQVSH